MLYNVLSQIMSDRFRLKLFTLYSLEWDGTRRLFHTADETTEMLV